MFIGMSLIVFHAVRAGGTQLERYLFDFVPPVRTALDASRLETINMTLLAE
jgi:hypothetical protein